MEYDVFISHASVDKKAVARPLAEELQARGLTVWLDEEQLQVGDSIRRGIDQALMQSRFGVVLLSPAYTESEWTRKELDALFTKEKYQNKTILPISCQLNREEIEAFSPMLADKITLSVDEGIEVLAEQIQGSIGALPKVQQQKSVSKGWQLKFPSTNWQWLIATVVALIAIVSPAWMDNTNIPADNKSSVKIIVDNNSGSISSDNVQGDKIENQTVINQPFDTDELAERLVGKMRLITDKSIQSKDDEIKRLSETIQSLKQQPSDEYKLEALKKLEEEKPMDAVALLKKSLANRDQQIKAEMQNIATEWVHVGNIAYLSDRKEALSAYQKAIEFDSTNTTAWLGIGKIQESLGIFDVAKRAYERATEIAPDNFWAWYRLGNVQMISGEIVNARKSLEKSLDVYEKIYSSLEGEALFNSLIYLSLGQVAEASEKPKEAELFFGRAITENNKFIAEARNSTEESDVTRTSDIQAALSGYQGYVYFLAGKHEKAEKHFLQVVDSDADFFPHAAAYDALGLIFAEKNNFKKSEEFYRKALKEYVNDGNEIRAAFVHLELGKIHLSNENNAESRNSLIQAYSGLKKTAHYEELAFIHKSLGLIDMYDGDLQKACDHWDKSIVLFEKTKNLSSTENQEIVQAMVPTLCAHL